MKLYTGKVSTIGSEIIRSLTEANDIEVSSAEEAQLDVEAILKEYIRLDREITDKVKDAMEQRKMDYGQFGRLKRTAAEERGFVGGEEAPTYLANQILEVFMHSPHVDEVFAEDVALRKKVKEILRKHMMVDEELDEEVRRRIKNLQEGTSGWDIEYAKMMDQIKRKHGISE